MTELIDYSGKFDPEFSYDKLNKDTLIKLLEGYARYMLRIDASWYLTIMEKLGNDEAFDCDQKVWGEGKQLASHEVKAISSLLNIQGNDVATVMKYIQVRPSAFNLKFDIDVKNNNHAIVTFLTCPVLLSIEKEGTGREGLICQQIEPKYLGAIAHHFNPEIQVNGLRVPPRKDYNDICCQWEFKLEK